MRLGVTAVVRDEAVNIGEWIAHYAFLGFTDIIVYDNGSSDNTADIVRETMTSAPVKLVDWSHRTDAAYQCAAYEDALANFGEPIDWMLFVDADEFLVTGGDLSVAQLLDALPTATAVGMNWAIYGSGGRLGSPAGLLIESYLTRAPQTFAPNQHVKSFVRPTRCQGFVNCHMVKTDGPYVDPLGEPMQWLSEGIASQVAGFSLMRLNHYFVQSKDDWARKMSRGYRDISRDDDVFAAYDRNEVYDNALECEAAILKNMYGFVRTGHPGTMWRCPGGIPEDFDSVRYLELNPDVAASTMTAEFHWKHHGCFEGRRY